MDLYPIQYGYEKCESAHFISLTTYDNYLFHYVVEGSGRVYIKSTDQKSTINKHEGFLITPGTTSSYKADEVTPWSYFWIEFNGIKAKKFLTNAGLTKEHYHFRSKHENPASQIISIFEQLIGDNCKQEPFIISQAYLLLNALIQNSEDNMDIENSDISNIYIREALKFIANNYQYNLSVDEVANYCNISRTHLSRLFSEELSLSPSRYLIKFRLNKAIDLLEDKNLSIKSIAEQVGYSNQFNFSTAFKKHFGVSPLNWRNQKINK